jgi:SAM-dependent methyltransferase
MICENCNSTEHKLIKSIENDSYINEEIKYYQCLNCGLVFIYPQPLKKLEKLYKNEYREKISLKKYLFFLAPYSFSHKLQINYIKYIKQFINGKGRKHILDIGSSEGKVLHLLKLRGWKVMGVEPTKHYAEFSNKILKIPTANVFFDEFETDKKFDLITLLKVFEHLPNPTQTLKKIKTLLKPGGHLYICIPHIKSDTFVSPHLFQYDEYTITSLVKKCGYGIKLMEINDPHIHLILNIEGGK